MNELKSHWKKWMYWFVLGISMIIIYKALDNFNNIADSLGKFFGIISPFFAGIFIAYLLYMPCRKIESIYRKSKIRIISKKARSLSIFTVYIIAMMLIIILINCILPVIFESITDFISNIQGYYDTAINKYNEMQDDSFVKQEIMQELMNNVQNINIKQYLNFDKAVLQYDH